MSRVGYHANMQCHSMGVGDALNNEYSQMRTPTRIARVLAALCPIRNLAADMLMPSRALETCHYSSAVAVRTL